MKRVISILVVLGFMWMLAIPGFATENKKFKSMLDDINDPKIARIMITGAVITAGAIYGAYIKDIEKRVDSAYKSGKLEEWASTKKRKSEAITALQILGKINQHLEKAISLLILQDEKGNTTLSLSLSQSYKGSMKDVRKAEKELFSAIKLINTAINDSPFFLFLKNQEKEPKNKK